MEEHDDIVYVKMVSKWCNIELYLLRAAFRCLDIAECAFFVCLDTK